MIMKTYVESLEESVEELSRRLAEAEAWVAWKSRSRLIFTYAMEVNSNNILHCTHIARSVMNSHLFVHKLFVRKQLGNVAFLEYMRIEYRYEFPIKRILFKMYHNKNNMGLCKVLKVVSV